MNLRFMTGSAIEEHPVEDFPALLRRRDGYAWLDIPQWTPAADALLTESLGVHPMATQACRERNHMPLVHGYRDSVFLVLHRPLVRVAGHAHLIELDSFLGERYLVTVHGPINPELDPAVTQAEVDETLDRLRAGRVRAETPAALLYALVSLIPLKQRVLVQDIARRVADLEGRVLGGNLNNPEASLEEMFQVRHELLTVRTMAAHTVEVLARMQLLARAWVEPADSELLFDLEDMFRRVHRMTDGEQEFLAGVIELYRTRTDTKMMIAGERLAVLAAVTLPVTAISSIVGMNVIVNTETHVPTLILLLVLMAGISAVLLRYTKRQGWW